MGKIRENSVPDIKKNLKGYEKYLFLVGFILFSILVYSHSMYFNFFVFDDHLNIYKNPKIQDVTISNFIWFWKNSLTPIIFNVWQTISLFFGFEEAWAYRFINIIVHGINGYIVFLLSWELDRKFELKISKNLHLFCALLFLTHPAMVESVVWVSSLRTTLSACFIFLFVLLNLQNDFKLNFKASVFFIASILTNPIFGGAIFVIPISHVLVYRQSLFKIDKDQLIDFFFLGLFLIVFFVLHKNNVISHQLFSYVGVIDRIQLAILSMFQYLRILIMPNDLLFTYRVNLKNLVEITNKELFIKSIVIIFVCIIPYSKPFKKHWRIILYCQLFILATIIPNLGFFLHDFNYLSIVANRYLYVALFPFTFLIVVFINKLSVKWWNVACSIAAMSAIFYLCYNVNQTFTWKSSPHIGSNIPEMMVAKGMLALSEKKTELARSIFFNAAKVNTKPEEIYGYLFQIYANHSREPEQRLFTQIFEDTGLSINSVYSLDAAKVYYAIDNYRVSRDYLKKYLNENLPGYESNKLMENLDYYSNEEKNYFLYRLIYNLSHNKDKENFTKTLFNEIDKESIYKKKATSLLK